MQIGESVNVSDKGCEGLDFFSKEAGRLFFMTLNSNLSSDAQVGKWSTSGRGT